MTHTLGLYKHIVDGKIEVIDTPHPLEGFYDKNIFIKRFISHFNGMTYEDISGGNNKLFKVFYNDCSYNIYIEAFDGGGRDSKDGSKKISITSSQTFKHLIDLGESVLIVNEYVPLKRNDNGEIELEELSIYGIIKPEEIYSSKVIRENTGNASSRWVGLDAMLDALNNRKMVMNNMNNVYVIPSNLISQYFDLRILDEQYEEMAKYIYEVEENRGISEEKIGRIFRDRLISQRGMECEFCNCHVNVSDQLVASHINSRVNIRNNNELTDEEKFELMSDPYNGFLLCRTHDAIFDKKHITVSNDGILIVAPDFRNLEREYNIDGYEGKKIIDVNENSIKYLEVHHIDFCAANDIDDLDMYMRIQMLREED